MKQMISTSFFVILSVAGGDAMAGQNLSSGQQPNAWSYYVGADWRFGVNGVSVDESGKAWVTLFDTVNDGEPGGAGILEAREGTYRSQAAENVRAALCDPSNQAGRGLDVRPTDNPQVLFSATCVQNGMPRVVQGNVAKLPKNIFDEFSKNVALVKQDVKNSGVKKLWINATVVKVEPRNGYYSVTVRFVNSGREEFTFKRPDLWSGNLNEETLSVGAINLDSKGEGGWEFELAGQPLENAADFKEETINLVSGAHRDFVFRAMPTDQNKAGTFAFSLSAWLYINWKDGDEKQRSHVDFFSGKYNRSTIKMDHDYPSTPQEREQWEATHRQDMSWRPVRPSETFAEDGLYRAVTLISGVRYRSLQVTPFKAGDVATTENVKMPMDGGNGININGPVQWEWEATAPTPVKQRSLDIVEDTRQFCAPGSMCPRSGRWVARVNAGSNSLYPEYRHDLSSLVTLRRGQPMPSIRGLGERADWEWVGG
jgi:hypothetical protein